MYGTLSTSIVVNILAIYFAYKLLQCELASKKWVFYIFIILHTFSLLMASFAMIMYAFFRDLYNESIDYVKNKTPPKKTAAKAEINTFTKTIVGILLTVYFIFSIVLIFIDLYFLYKLFQCNTYGFLLYIIAIFTGSVLQFLQL